MSTIDGAYTDIANTNLWLKIRSGDDIMLSDVPTIIPLRWTYFRDNWEFIKSGLQDGVSSYFDPDFLNDQIKEFSKFISAQRVGSVNINPFSTSDTFHKFYAIFDSIAIGSINMTTEETRLLNNTTTTVSAYSKNDFLRMRQNIIDFRDRTADAYGLIDEDYNRTYNKSSIPPQINATIVELNLLLTLQNSIKTIDFILANLFAVDSAVDPFALARANANNPDIDISSYSSGNLVTINYGENLESLANRYLGDPNKWIDIAIANGLKPPYIDEVGVRIPLISNGNGNQINLAETDISGALNIDRLYINQPIFLQSSTSVTPDQRTVISLRQIPVSGEIIIELDGPSNLGNYTVADNANIRVYQPNTINSSFYVLIPGTEPLDNSRKDEVPWFLAKSSEDEKQSKIDVAIDSSGEINFTTNGDLKLSYGLDNAIQAIRLKMSTELGSMRYHPEYGLVDITGELNSDIEGVRDTLIESINEQINADARYDRVEDLNIEYSVSDGTNEGVSAITINLSVKLAGSDKVIPIGFTVSNV